MKDVVDIKWDSGNNVASQEAHSRRAATVSSLEIVSESFLYFQYLWEPGSYYIELHRTPEKLVKNIGVT